VTVGLHAIVIAGLLASPAFAEEKAKPAPVIERSRVEVQPAGKAFKKLSIENSLGNVRIEGHDGKAIMIETHKHAPDEETLDRLRVSLVPDADGTVRITTAADRMRESKPQPRSSVAIDLVIRAPRDARVDATLGSGTLEVTNMDAGGELDTASGSISVKNISGELYTHSVSGHLSITQAFGPVDASTVSSDLDLDTIGGQKLVASANQGKIAGRRVRARDVELTTTHGSIVLEAEVAVRGRVVASSLRGDVDVKLRRNGGVVVRARGTKVDLPGAKAMPDGWMQTTLGQSQSVGRSAALVELRSRHGAVRFAFVQ
jgi:DUF4097 and DUF4098 domain-containing protein YvlB